MFDLKYLKTPEELKSDNGKDETNNGDTAADICNELKSQLMLPRGFHRMDVHQYSKIGQMITNTVGMGEIGGRNITSII